MVHRSQVLQLLVSVVFGVLEGELEGLFGPEFGEFHVGDGVGEGRLSDVPPLLFLGQDHHHDLADLEVLLDEPGDLFGVEGLDEQVVYKILGIGLEELSFIQEGESQSFKALVEPLGKFMAHFGVISPPGVPLEDVPRVVGLLVGHLRGVAPHSSLYEMHPDVLLLLVLDTEPHFLGTVQAVDELEERTPLEQVVAELVLEVGEQLKEVGIRDLGVAEDVAESEGQSGLYLQEGLKGYLVDLFETVAIEVCEVFYLELANEFLVGVRQEQLPQGPVGVDLEHLFPQFFSDQSLLQVFVDDALVLQVLDDGCLLLALGGLDVEQGAHFVGVEQDGLLVVEGVAVQIETIFLDEAVGTDELGFEELSEQFVGPHDVGVPGLGVDDDVVEQLVDLALEIFIREFLDFLQGHPSPTADLRTHDLVCMDRDGLEVFVLDILGNFQLVDWDLVVLHYLGHDEFLGGDHFPAPIEPGEVPVVLQFVEDEAVEFVLVDFPFEDGVGVDVLLRRNQEVHLDYLLCLQ